MDNIARGGPEVDETKELESPRRSLYIRQAPDIRAEFLAQCAAIADACTAPVRALVLVRQTTDSFFEESRRFGDGSPGLKNPQKLECHAHNPEKHKDKKNPAPENNPQ